MQVFIMRHGDAALDVESDPVRPLTHRGCDQSRQMAGWLECHSSEIERVLVSPYLRAGQTLAIVSEILTLPPEAETLPELAPEGDPQWIVRYLQALAAEGVKSVMLISHLPLVGYLVAELCPQEPPPMFATSAIACVDYDADGAWGKLLWQVSPAKLAKVM